MTTIDASSNLKFVSRSKELIVTNGVKHLPHEIEGVIDQARIKGITQTFAVRFTHRLPGFVTSCSGTTMIKPTAKLAMKSSTRLFEPWYCSPGTRPQVLPLASGPLDKTSLRKLSWGKVSASLAQGQYEAQEEFNAWMLQSYRDAHFLEPHDDIERELMTVLLNILGLDKPELGTNTQSPP